MSRDHHKNDNNNNKQTKLNTLISISERVIEIKQFWPGRFFEKKQVKAICHKAASNIVVEIRLSSAQFLNGLCWERY